MADKTPFSTGKNADNRDFSNYVVPLKPLIDSPLGKLYGIVPANCHDPKESVISDSNRNRLMRLLRKWKNEQKKAA